jgi:hypothetical protein
METNRDRFWFVQGVMNALENKEYYTTNEDKHHVLEDGSDGMDDDAVGELMTITTYKKRVFSGELPPPDKHTGMYRYWWKNQPELVKRATAVNHAKFRKPKKTSGEALIATRS